MSSFRRSDLLRCKPTAAACERGERTGMMIETCPPLCHSDSPAMDSTSPEVKSSSTTRATRNQLRLIFGYVLCMSVVNLLGPLALEWLNSYFNLSLGGRIVAGVIFFTVPMSQFLIGSVASVLLPGRLRFRLLLSIQAGITLMFSLQVGGRLQAMLTQPDFRPWSELFRETSVEFSYDLLALAAMQLPLWLARAWLKWRIEHVDERQITGNPSLSIRGLLLATAYVGTVLACARLGIDAQLTESHRPTDQRLELFSQAGALVVGGMILSLLTSAVIVPVCLRSTQPLVIRLAISVGYAIVSVIFAAVVVDLISDGNAFSGGVVPFLWVSIMVASSYSLAASVPLLIARRMGFELRWGRSQPALPSNDVAGS